ncbi:hypothetical protein L218DRAFT_715726 [Marasmius fiardii PR-910]|nr:hypothetical protein L218DRAFT_715726 [Marasmius fiardii PR-910]
MSESSNNSYPPPATPAVVHPKVVSNQPSPASGMIVARDIPARNEQTEGPMRLRGGCIPCPIEAEHLTLYSCDRDKCEWYVWWQVLSSVCPWPVDRRKLSSDFTFQTSQHLLMALETDGSGIRFEKMLPGRLKEILCSARLSTRVGENDPKLRAKSRKSTIHTHPELRSSKVRPSRALAAP